MVRKLFAFQFPSMKRCVFSLGKKLFFVDGPVDVRIKEDKVGGAAGCELTRRQIEHPSRINGQFLYERLEGEDAIIDEL